MNAAVSRNDIRVPESWEEQWSACMDGELESGQVDGLLAAWRKGDASARTWETYHLIGDVLRSPELAVGARTPADADFLAGVRARLAEEPAIVAPAPLHAPAQAGGLRLHWPHWGTWLAASGFVVVAAVAVVSTGGMSGRIPGGEMVSSLAQPASPATVTGNAVAAADPSDVRVADTPQGTLQRDPRFDAYVSAHSQFGNATALGAAGYLRSVAFDDDPGQP